MYTTVEAVARSGLTRPTFRKRVKLLKLEPILSPNRETYDNTKYWTDEQIEQIKNPPAQCPWCGSPYHDECYLANTRKHNPDRLEE